MWLCEVKEYIRVEDVSGTGEAWRRGGGEGGGGGGEGGRGRGREGGRDGERQGVQQRGGSHLSPGRQRGVSVLICALQCTFLSH